MTAVKCFSCGKFARAADCKLLRHIKSGNRRWFHKKPCLEDLDLSTWWEEADPSLGETTEEEELRNAGLVD